jgi:hypothetical protein
MNERTNESLQRIESGDAATRSATLLLLRHLVTRLLNELAPKKALLVAGAAVRHAAFAFSPFGCL